MFFQFNYLSKALKTTTEVSVILPDNFDGTYKTLWLLHGAAGNNTVWPRFSNIEQYANQYKIAVVMPSVNNSWYTDTAYNVNYFTFVTEELPNVCREHFKGMSDQREDNLVAGLSMGGYGALKIALTYPERYFGCASLSGALDITRKERPYDLSLWKSNFGFELNSALELEGTKHDIFHLAKQNCTENKDFPKIFMWCGTEDSLLKTNRDYHCLLTDLKIDHEYRESEGDHSWKWWDMHIKPALDFLLND